MCLFLRETERDFFFEERDLGIHGWAVVLGLLKIKGSMSLAEIRKKSKTNPIKFWSNTEFQKYWWKNTFLVYVPIPKTFVLHPYRFLIFPKIRKHTGQIWKNRRFETGKFHPFSTQGHSTNKKVTKMSMYYTSFSK